MLTGFYFYVILACGAYMFIVGLRALMGDLRQKADWWRWAFDVISTLIGLYLVITNCFNWPS